ncbi:hypothetical protein AAZX31_10G260600 [Glycine max]|uniref:CONSTANS-like zinc finger protein n=1 Tax=Glycine max TaxID=3847 RepID=I1LEW9_SOYBN|nr:zinc finger protein CONSTANS-LIKE 16-like [Glycine max]KAG4984563.1 hypothetical protein JHK87_029312 [Glycine soja]AEF12204.1 CONSTANS-like zinc finger protein [Glycine max]KAG5005371.1 hypothetical protein JHK86_029510 [Glycine max]KAG5128560.1 hypothetical protein JHK82_029395 [Glycine max]KAG5153165.1 hypothetical protein JHK84_029637 [Glycine max]|eukprot:NP_001278940.1 zinc finger protein CONSTANS-LIKE 16-like [Glycine max]
MSSATKNAANAVGAKTARACDSCITKRARWYCAADDAFLCQACDSSVHSANPLARRHERVRLKTASYKSTDEQQQQQQQQPPTWHTKKPRTPRHGKHSRNNNPFHLVPEEGSEEANSHDENEEQLLYRVPIFDPFVAELCGTNSSPSPVTSTDQGVVAAAEVEYKGFQSNGFCSNSSEMENLHGMLPSDAELAEFAADVESLLGRGLENECVGMEELGLVDAKEEECSVGSGKVKMEDQEESPLVEMEMDMVVGRDDQSFELSFDYETCEEVKVCDLGLGNELGAKKENDDEVKKNKISLQLDYEAVIIAWASQKSPWTTADKPNLDPDECWKQCMGSCETAYHHPCGEMGGFGIHPVIIDGGREARVSRYREKRRTRLFSKKIRYEVRKLNAEKRPRMKGRFVKRASFAPPTFPLLNK